MNLEIRTEKPKKLLNQGIVPGVLFGKQIESVSVQLPEKELKALVAEYGTNSTFDIKVDGKKHIVYIKELQHHVTDSRKILHFSLHKISKNDSIKAEVPLNFVGAENILKQKLLLQEIITKLEVEFPVGSGVNHIDVDVTNLKVDEALYVKDVKLPEGYILHTDPEQMLVNVAYPKTQAAEEQPAEQESDSSTEETAPAEQPTE